MDLDHIISDSQPVPMGPGPATVTYFGEVAPGRPERSVADIHEDEIGDYLFAAYPGTTANLILSKLRLQGNTTQRAFRLGAPFAFPNRRGRVGDLDVLLADEAGRAVAVECKRVKAKAEGFERGELTKMERLKRGARQARALIEIGYHRVFLLVVVQVEGWEQEGNDAARGATPLHFRRLLASEGLAMLPNEAGIIVVEAIQPTARPFESRATVGARVWREAAEREQPLGLTDMVRDRLYSRE